MSYCVHVGSLFQALDRTHLQIRIRCLQPSNQWGGKLEFSLRMQSQRLMLDESNFYVRLYRWAIKKIDTSTFLLPCSDFPIQTQEDLVTINLVQPHTCTIGRCRKDAHHDDCWGELQNEIGKMQLSWLNFTMEHASYEQIFFLQASNETTSSYSHLYSQTHSTAFFLPSDSAEVGCPVFHSTFCNLLRSDAMQSWWWDVHSYKSHKWLKLVYQVCMDALLVHSS